MKVKRGELHADSDDIFRLYFFHGNADFACLAKGPEVLKKQTKISQETNL